MLSAGQTKQKIVYWPSTPKRKAELRLMSNSKKSDTVSNNQNDPERWKQHLIAVAERQDQQAYHALYCHFAPKLKTFYMHNGFAAQAEEMTQEVFIRVWKRACTYNADKSAVSTWIYSIARNYRIDVLRKKQIQTVDQDSVPEAQTEQGPDHEVSQDKSGDKLTEVMKELSMEQRMVLQKVYFEDKSHQVAANELAMTPGVIKSRIRSALKILRGRLGDEWL
jgi:RNA polymerase sigma-70 factor, ECF subfamily